MTKIVVGLSGGVDSFVTALLLQEQGFEVIGVNLRLWDSPASLAQENELDNLCHATGIELLRVDGRALFARQVVDPFVKGYLSGVTPNPCAICNSFVKWHLLRVLADDLKVHHIATGHYIRILSYNQHYYVKASTRTKTNPTFYGVSGKRFSPVRLPRWVITQKHR